MDDRSRVVAHLESGKHIHVSCLMYAIGRQANTDLLNLQVAGLPLGSRGKLEMNAVISSVFASCSSSHRH